MLLHEQDHSSYSNSRTFDSNKLNCFCRHFMSNGNIIFILFCFWKTFLLHSLQMLNEDLTQVDMFIHTTICATLLRNSNPFIYIFCKQFHLITRGNYHSIPYELMWNLYCRHFYLFSVSLWPMSACGMWYCFVFIMKWNGSWLTGLLYSFRGSSLSKIVIYRFTFHKHPVASTPGDEPYASGSYRQIYCYCWLVPVTA